MEADVIAKISETLGVKETDLTVDTKIVDIIQGSLDMVEIMAVLSTEFNAEIKSADLGAVGTIGDLVDYIKTHPNQPASAQPLDRF